MNWALRKISWSRLAGLTLLAGLIAIRIADPIFLQNLRNQAFDTYQQLSPRPIGQFPVTILDVDDKSLREIGQWPWPRTQIAKMTEKAMKAGVAALAFDIIFSEPDRLSPDRIAQDNGDLPDPIRRQLALMPSNDEVLSNTFAGSRVVVGQTSVRTEASNLAVGEKAQVRVVPHAILGPDPSKFMLNFPDLIQNLPILEEKASGRGVFTVRPDPDGIYRRVPIVMNVQDQFRLGLSIELLRIATGGDAFAIRSNEAGIDGVVVARQLIKTSGDGTVWMHYSGSDRGRYVSATDLIHDRVPPGRLAGHLVLVGTSAIGLEDFRPTPLGVPMAGVEIHAQVLENILGNSLLSRPNYAIALELTWIAVLSLFIIALAPLMPARWLILTTVLIVGSYFGFSYYLFVENRRLLDPTFPVFATLMTVMLMSSANYIREELRRQQIRSAFGQYVSPELVARLAEDPERLTLGGEKRDLTLLFSDVRGFTTISEEFKDDPAGLTRLMNRFLTVMSNAIMAHGGTIDKFMGDAVMAFWNAPLDSPDHPKSCCAAALKMRANVEELNAVRRTRRRTESDRPFHPINIGIGINTGTCVVGNMGSETRFDYSALGDAVNLASRLEGQTKDYGVGIILGSSTAEAVEDEFAVIELDLIRVKGKTLPERIFALLGDRGVKEGAAFSKVCDVNAEMIEAYRAQDWDSALAANQSLFRITNRAEIDLRDYALMYHERLTNLQSDPPGPEWDGVYDARSK